MKKLITAAFALVLTAAAAPCEAFAEEAPPEVSARAAAVITADTAETVFLSGEQGKLPMASTTKIMTAMLTIESGGLYEEFTVDPDAIMVEGSSMGLLPGDKVTKYDLCCGMLLPSGNDAANAAAVRIAGSTEAFAELMNARARELGLGHTYFVTPSGLEGEGHGSSALDMAMLAREALKSPIFREICSQESMKLSFGDPPYDRWLRNTNKLLSLYGGTYGVKTGFTDEAGRCLVSACERDGKRLICVTLNDRNDWNDHMALYDYAFGQAELISPAAESAQVAVVGSEKESVSCAPGELPEITALEAGPEELTFTVISAPFVYAPVSVGEELAQLSIAYNGREITRVPLLAEEEAPKKAAEPEKPGVLRRIFSMLRRLFS
ncbi:MAG: D-alanyl-D-alanine carboxypeptidase [Ruminococcus sp.]|nr:D-alanyl-D-alanine carboxypeptidase [Ruminococcus sp.]